ncbi:hypothetical protein [Actibacterium sp. XHP0104]|uniref:hypothetical protein n=1 Tax=Actibacterium sp. XHP0104 TaxID=2984335 RepID=UPI0021E6EC30|nr:hypothetical protein [Actibacterium sp. XHP0104]MCV2881773.1 hypothetical protein [Actibacterium sp. XHP0104]
MAAALLLWAAPVAALEKYNCVTADFTGFGHEGTDFQAKNLRKTYQLLVKDDEVVVFTKSPDFNDNEKRYRFVMQDALDRFAVSEDGASFDMLSIPNRPGNRVATDGYFDATLSLTSSFFVNAWLLRCTD